MQSTTMKKFSLLTVALTLALSQAAQCRPLDRETATGITLAPRQAAPQTAPSAPPSVSTPVNAGAAGTVLVPGNGTDSSASAATPSNGAAGSIDPSATPSDADLYGADMPSLRATSSDPLAASNATSTLSAKGSGPQIAPGAMGSPGAISSDPLTASGTASMPDNSAGAGSLAGNSTTGPASGIPASLPPNGTATDPYGLDDSFTQSLPGGRMNATAGPASPAGTLDDLSGQPSPEAAGNSSASAAGAPASASLSRSPSSSSMMQSPSNTSAAPASNAADSSDVATTQAGVPAATGSPAPTATHDAQGNPYPPADASALTGADIAGVPPSDVGSQPANATDSNPFAGLEADFPTYTQYFDNQTDAVVHPYLAETDTIFSTDSDREYGPTPYESRYRALDDTAGTFDVLKRWGSYAPYFSNPMYPALQQQKSIPNHCSIQQVHMLHRSGARMPLDVPAEAVNAFRTWHANATTGAQAPDSNTTFEGPLTFLNSWQYGLGTNELTRAGYQQMYDSGVHSFYRYGGLFNETTETHKIVMRTTSTRRLFDGAEAWAVGFFGFKGASKAASIQVEIEQPDMNNTLAPEKACPSAATQKPGSDMAKKWIDHYTERAVKRLQHFVKGASLTSDVVYAMQQICPYETYALGMSDFCSLFTRNEWDSFEYAQDLRFQGDYGFMSPTGRAQGIGWAQEFVSRLKGEKLKGGFTSQNTTLHQDDHAFPLDQRMYLDFAHDNLLVSVLTALNFTSFDTKLDPLHRDRTRNFIMSHMSPFAARLFFEVLECDEADGQAKEKYVRALLNDALLPMSTAQGCIGHPSTRDGLCPLDKFVKHFETESVPAADFAKTCYGSTPANVTGAAPVSDATAPNVSAGTDPMANAMAGNAGGAGDMSADPLSTPDASAAALSPSANASQGVNASQAATGSSATKTASGGAASSPSSASADLGVAGAAGAPGGPDLSSTAPATSSAAGPSALAPSSAHGTPPL